MSDDLRLLTIISDLAAIAIENAKLYHRIEEMAIRDGLTGLYCRRYFKERCSRTCLRSAGSGNRFRYDAGYRPFQGL